MVHVILIILGILILIISLSKIRKVKKLIKLIKEEINLTISGSILKKGEPSELDSFMELDKQKHEVEIQQQKSGEKLVKHLTYKKKELTKERKSLKKIVKYIKDSS